jgi:hypothetical protein
METLYFEAYCHVCALMWRVIFKELRGLTNSKKGLEIDPLALNGIYEQLYDVGNLLQTNACLSVFDPSFRPWPHVYQNKQRSEQFYLKLERNLQPDMERLRDYHGRADKTKYETTLRQVLGLFGQGIIASLEFTMKDYLHQTGGHLRTELRDSAQVAKCKLNDVVSQQCGRAFICSLATIQTSVPCNDYWQSRQACQFPS